jgi:hypothetical protein
MDILTDASSREQVLGIVPGKFILLWCNFRREIWVSPDEEQVGSQSQPIVLIQVASERHGGTNDSAPDLF